MKMESISDFQSIHKLMMPSVLKYLLFVQLQRNFATILQKLSFSMLMTTTIWNLQNIMEKEYMQFQEKNIYLKSFLLL